jgi:hypothetical protein
MAFCGEASLDQHYLQLLSSIAAAGRMARAVSLWKQRAARNACCSRTVALRRNDRGTSTVRSINLQAIGEALTS